MAYPNIVKLCLELGSDYREFLIGSLDGSGRNALANSVCRAGKSKERLNIVKQLVKAREAVPGSNGTKDSILGQNVIDVFFVSPFCHAVKSGHLDIVKFLWKSCPSDSLWKDDAMTPLWHAANNGYDKMVRTIFTFKEHRTKVDSGHDRLTADGISPITMALCQVRPSPSRDFYLLPVPVSRFFEREIYLLKLSTLLKSIVQNYKYAKCLD
jgi:hypothetical protein